MPVFSKRIGNFAVAPFVAVGLFSIVSSAQAAPIVNFAIGVNGGTGGNYNAAFNQLSVAGGIPGTHTVAGSHLSGGGSSVPGEWSIEWDFLVDDDPTGGPGAEGVNFNPAFTVQNTSNANLQFSILVSMAVLPSSADVYAFGASNNLASLSGGQVTMSTTNAFGANAPIWDFQLNGSSVGTQFPAPHTLTTSQTQAENGPGGFGVGGGSPSTIGVRLVFDLSPGAEINFNGTFQYIPTPGALALLGLAAVAGRRRRR